MGGGSSRIRDRRKPGRFSGGGGSSGNPEADQIRWGGGVVAEVFREPGRFSGGGVVAIFRVLQRPTRFGGGGGGSSRNFPGSP